MLLHAYNSPKNACIICQSLLVRPHLEYGCAAWDPHLCQLFACSIASRSRNAGYEELLDTLEIPTHLKLSLLYNIQLVLFPQQHLYVQEPFL